MSTDRDVPEQLDEDDEDWIVRPGNEVKLPTHITAKTVDHLPALAVLAVLDEVGNAAEVGKLFNRTGRWVTDTVKELAKDLGVDSLIAKGSDSKWRASGRIASEARDLGRSIVFRAGNLDRLRDRNIRVRYLPQHGFFMAKVEAELDPSINLHPKTLGEEDRSVERFLTEVIAAVAEGAVDLAIGLPPERSFAAEHRLEVTYLYSSRQEAMVRREDPLERITLGELIQRDLLLPPENTRSRGTLETVVRADAPHSGPLRIRREAFGTKVLIQYGMSGLGTVVVPSDISHVFKHGKDYGGPPTAAYKWIPVVRTDGREIYQRVCATMRALTDIRSDHVRQVLAAIQREVKRQGLETNLNAKSVLLDQRG